MMMEFSVAVKDDFQSVLCALEGLFAFLFDPYKTSTNVTFRNYLHK